MRKPGRRRTLHADVAHPWWLAGALGGLCWRLAVSDTGKLTVVAASSTLSPLRVRLSRPQHSRHFRPPAWAHTYFMHHLCYKLGFSIHDPDILLWHPKQHGGFDVAQRRLQTRLEFFDTIAEGSALQKVVGQNTNNVTSEQRGSLSRLILKRQIKDQMDTLCKVKK